ncbi:MAG: hypothetical protein AABY28_04230 [Candidatus Omnitrophota bacterium]
MVSFLFYFLSIVFLIAVVTIFLNKNSRTFIHFFILVLLLLGLIFLCSRGSKVFKFGSLEIKIEEANNQGKFEIINLTDQNVEKKIKIAASSVIDNVKIVKGSNFLSIIDGGKGNNYVIYNVNIPPKTIASGTIASAGPLSIIPQEIKK